MERHKCKLCSRTFSNGRALGGHMKSHFPTLPLPSKTQPQDEDEEEKALIYYGLRENPKKCFRLADPEFDTGSVVQDRESETESKNPTGRRSKRTRRPANSDRPKRPKLSFMESPEPLSSVSDTSPEEDVAMCLMMLSRDRWSNNNDNDNDNNTDRVNVNAAVAEEIKLARVRHRCHTCHKTFRSSRALAGHASVCRGSGNDSKIFQCPFCSKVFGSGQALGGHKRSHLVPSSSSNVKLRETFIDLNLPAPADEDDLSVLSDA